MGTGEHNVTWNGLASHPGRGRGTVVILLVASCYRNQVRLCPCGPPVAWFHFIFSVSNGQSSSTLDSSAASMNTDLDNLHVNHDLHVPQFLELNCLVKTESTCTCTLYHEDKYM